MNSWHRNGIDRTTRLALNVLLLAMISLSSLAIYVHAQGDNYVEVDPAIRDMQISLEMPRASPSAEAVSTPSASPPPAGVPPLNVLGTWHFDLTGGVSIDMNLNQSGGVIFGHGNVTSGNSTQYATTSGFIQGSSLRLDVVPADGTKLYALGLDMSRLPPTGTFSIYGSGLAPQSGIIRANRL